MKKAAVIGSGPNGLTAAILLAQAGLETTVYEEQPTFGGGMRTAELTLPGFHHDVASAVHPMAAGSPVFHSFPLASFGLSWVHPPSQLAHPFDDGTAKVVKRSVAITAEQFGRDAVAYRALFGYLSRRWNKLATDILQPVVHVPSHPLVLGRFGVTGALPASVVAKTLFRTEEARAVFAGMAAHSVLPLDASPSAAFGMIMHITAHALGWPVARGGSQSIANALAGYLQSLGGKILTSTRIDSLAQFDRDTVVMCDVSPRQFVAMAGDRLPSAFARKLERFHYGPGVFKMDWALSEPVPWRAKECAGAATVHLGGSYDEIFASEHDATHGRVSERPFVLFVQPSLFDASRAPEGKHTAWAYCHVPQGCTEDMTERIEAQVERFAPGFRSTILARSAMGSHALEAGNRNLVGGDITGGAQDIRQLLMRPTRHLYRTPLRNVYLCSASTPPGGAVHGMCGYHAVQAAVEDWR